MGSDFLFSRPRAVFGAARTLDLAGQFDEYNTSQTPMEADALGLISDLLVTRSDLESAGLQEPTPSDRNQGRPVRR